MPKIPIKPPSIFKKEPKAEDNNSFEPSSSKSFLSPRLLVLIALLFLAGAAFYFLKNMSLKEVKTFQLPKELSFYEPLYKKVAALDPQKSLSVVVRFDEKLGFLVFANLPDGTHFRALKDGKYYSDLKIQNFYYWDPKVPIVHEPFQIVISSESLPQYKNSKGIKNNNGEYILTRTYNFYIPNKDPNFIFKKTKLELSELSNQVDKLIQEIKSTKIENSKITALQEYINSWGNNLKLNAQNPDNKKALTPLVEAFELLKKIIDLAAEHKADIRKHEKNLIELQEEFHEILDSLN